MQGTTRRTLLKILLRLPIVAGIVEWGLFGRRIVPFGAVDAEDHERYEKKLLAVRILRFINTTQRWHFDAFGHYADIAELRTSEATERWLDDKRADKAGLDRSLYSMLHLERREIVPGWEFQFRLKDDRRSYIVTLKDSSGNGLGAYSTDQEGIIHEGESLAAADADGIWQSAQLVLAGKPIEAHERRGLASLFRAFAFGPVTALAGCCTQYPCGCGCTCTGSSQPLCSNCGCSCCIWCCCPY